MKPIGRASFVVVAALLAFLMPAAGEAASRPPGRAIAGSDATTTQTGLKVEWQKARSTWLGNPVEIRGGAYANGSYVVFGWTNDDPAIWRSTDAVNWKAVWRGEGGGLLSVVAGGPGFVASTWSEILISRNGSNWTSVPDGLPDGASNSLGSVAGVVVAFPTSGTGYWTVDGRNWEALPAGSGPDGAIALAGDGTHLWAFTGGWDWETKTGRPIEVWATDDGRSWTKSADLPGSRRVSYLTAAFGPRGGVVVAEAPHKAWFSTDNVHWQRATNTPTLTPKGVAFVDMVVADNTGFVATAHRDPPGCVWDEAHRRALTWTSVDGRIWREMPEKGWLASQIAQLFVRDRTLIGIGFDWTDAQSPEAVWRATLPEIAQDNAPPPDPIARPEPGGCGP